MFRHLPLAQKIVIQLVLLVLGIIYATPLLNVVLLSFRGGGLDNYRRLFSLGMPLGRMVINSIFVSTLQVLLIVIIGSLAAFSFSKINFRGKNILYAVVILCMTIPMISLITPLFTILRRFDMLNTYRALVLPSATMWLPVAVIIFKNYYDGLPNELLESAVLDGCSWFNIFRHIFFPMGKPATVNVVIFAFMHAWNDFLNPLLFSRTLDMYTLPMAVNAVTTTREGSRPEIVFATLVIMAIPSLLVYIGLQKYLGEGMTAGSLKG